MKTLETNDWIILNTIIYKVYTMEDFDEMRKELLEQLKLLVDFDSADFYLASAEDEKKLAAAVTEDDKKLLWSGVRHMRRKIQSGGINVTLRSVIFHLGDLEMITIPGELFSTFGMEIKKNFNAPMRIVWGYANYSAGYIVEKDEYGKGYESRSTPFPQGEAELYVDHLIKSL